MLLIDQCVSKLQAAGMPAHVSNNWRANVPAASLHHSRLDCTAQSLLIGLFVWHDSPEGGAYWIAQYKRLDEEAV